MGIIVAKELVTKFGKNVIHDKISFEVGEGEIFGLLGGSGSGKSTLLREMILLQRISGGSLSVNGYDVSKISDADAQKLRRSWGVLFQFGALFSSLTVLENVMIALNEYTNLPQKMIKEIALMKIDLVGLPQKAANLNPSELSGGMKKRAGLARALSLDPKLLFLDEPTSGLDPKSSRAFDELIIALNRSLNLSIVMVTHDKDSIRNSLDRFIVLNNSRVVFDGSYAQMQANPKDEYIDFLE